MRQDVIHSSNTVKYCSRTHLSFPAVLHTWSLSVEIFKSFRSETLLMYYLLILWYISCSTFNISFYAPQNMSTVMPNVYDSKRAKALCCYLSLYLITASTIFLIFFVRAGGFGESFSAGGRPLFLCLFPSSSLSPLDRPPEEEEGPGRSRSRSRFLFRVVFLWRTSSSTSSSVPSSIACTGKTQTVRLHYIFLFYICLSALSIPHEANHLKPLLLSQWIAVIHLLPLPRTSSKHFLLLLLAGQPFNLSIVLHNPRWQLILLHQTRLSAWVTCLLATPV